MNFKKNLNLLFVLINFQSIESIVLDPKVKTENIVCGVNDSDSDFKFNPSVRPNVRQTSSPILEIGLFYDQSFYDKHSNNLQDFMKSVLRQVQIIFEYPSIPQIRFVVTRLIKIESHEVPKQELLEPYFDKLCDFQFYKYWNNDKDYDLALFFSGYRFFSKFFGMVQSKGRLNALGHFIQF